VVSDDPSSGPIREEPPDGIDANVPHSARIWNYWLGGKDNYAVDQQTGDQIIGLYPDIVTLARTDRLFLGRAVRYLTGEAGIRQFLDIGTGLPTVDNTHEVAQRVAPESRIVYVDNDPLVLVHARALLVGTREGATEYIEADVRDPDAIVHEAARTLDFTRPVAVMLLGILNFVLDDNEARAIVQRLMDAVPPGSHLAITHPTSEIDAERYLPTVEHWNKYGTPKMRTRTREEITRFFDGLQILDPGVVSFPHWRPEPSPWGQAAEVPGFCAVGRKQ
jgi:O-methyltransferase involved in polyketide biosynthesis